MFVVQHPRRDALQEHLTSGGIGTLIHYPRPPHLSEAYAEMALKPGAFPISEEMARTVLSLPFGPHISTEDVQAVIAAVKAFAR
jgi:dTDP-4-amino-4,6-dideoxygalactose transaminase